MGHHHKRHRRTTEPEQVQMQQENTGMDIGAMLQNLNLGDIDLSKVDMNKVQSMLDKMKSPSNALEASQNTINSGLGSYPVSSDQTVNVLNTIREFVPEKKAKKIDRVLKLIQLTNVMNNGYAPARNQTYHSHENRKHKR